MGVAYTELGEFKEAIEAHEKAIKIKPDSHKAYYILYRNKSHIYQA
jgi:tetratricopeptide (TPR) repeat protein